MEIDREESAYVRLFNTIKAAKDVAEALTVLRDDFCEVAHITYHHAQTLSGQIAVDAPFVRTTYPDKWIARYLLKGYVTIDPIVREGLSRQLPFNWSEVELRPESIVLFTDFQAHGLGADGYSKPIIDKAGRRALLSLNSKPDTANWSTYVGTHQQEWAELAYVVHRKAIVELYGEKDPVPQIGPREIQTLYWIGQGKEAKDIGVILGISEHTVRSYMRSVRFKLDCANLSQAVAKAMMLRLIKA